MPRTYNLEPCCLIFWCFQCPGPMLSCFWCFNGTYNWLSELYERYAFASIKIPILLFLSGQITLNWCCILLSEGGSVPSHQKWTALFSVSSVVPLSRLPHTWFYEKPFIICKALAENTINWTQSLPSRQCPCKTLLSIRQEDKLYLLWRVNMLPYSKYYVSLFAFSARKLKARFYIPSQ